MAQNHEVYPETIDYTNCDKEPIHIIGKSQSHGVLLACNPKNLKITQAGENFSMFFGDDYDDITDVSLSSLIGERPVIKLKQSLEEGQVILPEEVEVNRRKLLMLAHLSGPNLIVEFEEQGKFWDSLFFQRQLTKILNNLSSTETISGLCANAAKLTREVFRYDRVMIYKFDEEWNGQVIAEEKKDQLESWLGLHYPASDIPQQSRKLFLKHKIRIIADVNYKPVRIFPTNSPLNNKPLDLSRAELRAVSPIHIEYLKNMKVGASLTAAIVANGKVWGLLACHHYSAKFISYFQRETCKFLTQVFSNHLAVKESGIFLDHNKIASDIREKLVVQMRQEKEISQALTRGKNTIMDVLTCGGGAVVLNDQIELAENTPGQKEIKILIEEFLGEKEETLFFTKNLKEHFPQAENYKKAASGLLSVRIGGDPGNYLLWFRPEIPLTVTWGGDPNKTVTFDEEKQQLGPRKSFEKWTENLTGVSEAWKDFEISAATALQENVSHVLVEKQKEEISRLNGRLLKANEDLEIFSYGISHDLRGPLRGIDGYAQILKEDHFGELSEEGKEVVNTIITSAEKMNTLIDDILSFSRITRGKLKKEKINPKLVLEDILKTENLGVNYPNTQIIIQEDLPVLEGDYKMVKQVFWNLINNALKFSANEEKPKIEIGGYHKDDKTVCFVKDNGIGIEESRQDLIFEVFEQGAGKGFLGNGIGLALVKRILKKHRGNIWVESKAGKGCSFYFNF